MMKLSLKNSLCACFLMFFLNACALTDNIGNVPQTYSIQVDDSKVGKPTVRFEKQMTLTLADFSATSMISTIRIAVLNENNRVRYVKDATWVDTPQIMLNQQLNELLQNVDPNLVVANYQERIRSNYLLQGQVMRFYYNDVTKQVDIKIDLKLFQMPGKKLIAQKQFQTYNKVWDETLVETMISFQQASTKIMADLQNWIVKNL